MRKRRAEACRRYRLTIYTERSGGSSSTRNPSVAPNLGESARAPLVLDLVLVVVLDSLAGTSAPRGKFEDEDEIEIEDDHGQRRGGCAQGAPSALDRYDRPA